MQGRNRSKWSSEDAVAVIIFFGRIPVFPEVGTEFLESLSIFPDGPKALLDDLIGADEDITFPAEYSRRISIARCQYSCIELTFPLDYRISCL